MDLWIRRHLPENSDPTKAPFLHNVTRTPIELPAEETEGFWVQYCDSVRLGTNPHLSEVTKNRHSVQLGFDFELKFDRPQIPYKAEIVMNLTSSIDRYVENVTAVIQMQIQNYFEATQSQSEIFGCYLRREDNNVLLWKNDTVEYTGRLIFPYAHVKSEYLSRFSHLVLTQLQLTGHTPDRHLPISPVTGLDTFIRPRTGETIEMYGSSFSEGVDPLKLVDVFGLLNTDVKASLQVEKIFVPTFHGNVVAGKLSINTIVSKTQEHGLKYWLPLFFSSDFFDHPLKAKDGISLEMQEPPKITISVIKENGEVLSKVERARQLLKYISLKRMDHYWSWIDIGQALKTVDSVEGLQLWKWMTNQSDFKGPEDCDLMWPTFDGSEQVDIETLEYFASLDNPDGFEKYREQEVRAAMNKAITEQTHTAVAKAFKACFPHKFICSNFEAGMWFMYNGSRWTGMSGTSYLEYYVNEMFRPKLEQLQAKIAIEITQSRDQEFKDRNQNFQNMIGQLIIKLGNNGFKNSLCREMKIYYWKDHFNQLKDRHPDYTAHPTCVTDVRGGEAVQRPGKPQDYCYRCTRYDPLRDGSWEHPSVKMCTNYLKQVFRGERLYHYVLRFLASLLKSGNSNKLFPIFSGEGQNSKSVLVRIIEAAFGNYAVKLPTTLITGKSTQSDGATPSVIHSSGAKVAFLEEPNRDEVIRSGSVKKYTGQDTLYVRDLFQKGSQIVEMFLSMVPILVANKIPVIPDCQEAIWNRTRVIGFSSKWSANAPSDPKEQFIQGIFRLDKHFDRNVPILAPALLWIMCQMYGPYFSEGLIDCPEVLEATSNFQIANNFYIHFTKDCFKVALKADGTIDTSAVITLDEIYGDFRKWYADQQFRERIPVKSEFKENIQLIWKVKADVDNKWYGYIRLNAQRNAVATLLTF